MQIQQITLTHTPQGAPEVSDFAMGHTHLSGPQSGEVLVRVHALSMDPYLRSAMAGKHLSASIHPGDLVRGEGLVEVIESHDLRMVVGEKWVAPCGWRTHAVLDAQSIPQCRRVDPQIIPTTLALGGLGMPGLTAWAGFNLLCKAQPNQTWVVSAASGAVGATVGQLARIAGCRVIGIAGGPEKCDWVQRVAGFNDCIDYKNTHLATALKQQCPNGIDVYFDNVGGDILNVAIENLALHARVVLCGLMSQYNGASPSQLNAGLLIRARATVQGLVVYDHWQHMQQMTKELGAFYQAGQLHFREDIQHGLDQVPAAFCRLMRGENQGKSVVLLDN